ncbi:oligopeptide transporter, OPT family [Sulfidibacter corallicola]|uniref:Oligopeptide transporter, OPT family n=1 Tax=Sulfidibacter corallicola TaxID=2818388 RepID=A0A8A4TWB6_SULCO|nr:oligopeptide transporter, OPT family [Sulfidibacter corallicola]QTD53468.1 oligopeptide transporter, OPT family [Sulfidibacter corallicola]
MSEQKRKLPSNAYTIKEGETYVPYTHGQTLTEVTFKAVITGIVLGVIFGAANTYLGLKAGLTISTSIPVAVLSVVAFKLFSLVGTKHNILETNMSQTIGSASSSVASGVLFTLPALFIWGMDPDFLQITFLAMAGGLTGILAMVPLRRYLIKKEHGKLPYPEGMACAEVLVAAEHGGKQASGVFWGIGTGIVLKVLTSGLKLIPESFSWVIAMKAKLAIKVSPALTGVGYILGLRVATIMVSGSALAAFVITPIIYWWGMDLNAPFYPETQTLIRDMSAGDIWNRYIRYIGAGAVATGGIITLIQSIPAMIESFRIGLQQLKNKGKTETEAERTDHDLSLKVVGAFLLVILLVLTLVPGILGYIDAIPARGVSAILIAVFAFFFVTVSSRIVGLVGVTSNPTSGMTIATLIGTSLIFYMLGWRDMEGKATALMVGTVVCIAASIAGDTSQDLKTGFVLGATPRLQQIGELVGVITSAGFVCAVLILLHKSHTLGSAELPAPQAALMKLVIDGVLDQKLPWNLVMIGVVLAIAVFIARIPPLPFAVGVYLPLSTMAAVFVGGLLRHILTRKQGKGEAERRREQGTLFASGLVGGEGLTGVLFAGYVAWSGSKITGLGMDYGPGGTIALAVVGILALVAVMSWQAKRKLH